MPSPVPALSPGRPAAASSAPSARTDAATSDGGPATGFRDILRTASRKAEAKDEPEKPEAKAQTDRTEKPARTKKANGTSKPARAERDAGDEEDGESETVHRRDKIDSRPTDSPAAATDDDPSDEAEPADKPAKATCPDAPDAAACAAANPATPGLVDQTPAGEGEPAGGAAGDAKAVVREIRPAGSDPAAPTDPDAAADGAGDATDEPAAPSSASKPHAPPAPRGPLLGGKPAGRDAGEPATPAGGNAAASAKLPPGGADLATGAPPELPDAGPVPDLAAHKPSRDADTGPVAPSFDLPPAKAAGPHVAAAPPAAPDAPPEAQFAEANHAKIITGIKGELLPDGGTMQLRLDPPELGDLVVSLEMRNGAMTASFQTSNDDATRRLSHSLGDLKSMLEAQGVTVEKLHVQQAPRQESGTGGDGNPRQGNGSTEDQHNARREQQRREMIQKLWDKLGGGKDPLDLVA